MSLQAKKKKHYKKKLLTSQQSSSSNKPDLFAFLAYTVILFFGATILVNINPNSNSNYRSDRNPDPIIELEWSFRDIDKKNYSLSNMLLYGMHGSSPDFSFLLPPQDLNAYINKTYEPPYTINMQNIHKDHEDQRLHGSAPNNILATNIDIYQTNVYSGIKQILLAAPTIWDKIEDRSLFVNILLEYLISGEINDLPEGAIKYILLLYQSSNQAKRELQEEHSCITPWDYTLQHGQSTFAYQQRADIPELCNIERRVCINGKMTGSFTQQHCEESFSHKQNSKNYEQAVQYEKKPVISHNTFVPDEFIQPPKEAANAGGDFRTDGKPLPEDEPKLIPGEGNDPLVAEDPEIALNPNTRSYCQTPRGEKVNPGQFVKAYRHQNGFTDIPCKVQLRLCVDGELEGTYDHPTCTPWNTAYEDFLNGYMNGEQPSPQRLLKMLEAPLVPDPEYGNNLNNVLIDQILKLLRE